MVQRCARHRFDQALNAPRLARRFGVRTVDEWQLPVELDVVELLVSELVTNAVVHARSGGEIVMRSARDGLEVEVTDTGEGEPALRDSTPDALGGRGIAILDALADSWGVRRGEDHPGKTVWFRLRLA
jgi:anti-sigma regulatory factor (Ser/Thr protein kinase)